jgi:hypothetical protein
MKLSLLALLAIAAVAAATNGVPAAATSTAAAEKANCGGSSEWCAWSGCSGGQQTRWRDKYTRRSGRCTSKRTYGYKSCSTFV